MRTGSMAEGISLLVFGSLAFDEIYRYDGTVRDHLLDRRDSSLYLNIRARGPEIRRGGCGGNVSFTLGSLHLPIHLFSWIGRDGDEYVEFLRHRGVDTGSVIKDASASTPRAVLLSDRRNDQVLIFSTQQTPAGWRLPKHVDAALAVVTTGIPEKTEEITSWLGDCDIPYIIDPGKFILDIPPAHMVRILEGADTIILNEYERDLLLKRCGLDMEDLLTQGRSLVVTRDSRGATLFQDTGKEDIPAVKPGCFIDPAGAGDAFLAGFAAGRYMGYSLLWSARMGSAAASFALEKQGAQEHDITMDRCMERVTALFGTPP